MRTLRQLAFITVTALAFGAVGCDQSNAPLVATADAPVDPTLFPTTTKLGVDLYWRETALRRAVEEALPKLGSGVKNTRLLPFVTLDESGKMAQVHFFRWLPRDIPTSGEVGPDGASRWLIVPVNLATGIVLETEQDRNYLEPAEDEYQFVACILSAGEVALATHPGGRWDFHPSREIKRDGTPGTDRHTRIYALGVGGGAPDLEFVFGPAKKGERPPLLAQALHHDAKSFVGASIDARVSAPSPMTVARALANKSGPTTVTTPAGQFSIAPGEGTISQVGPAVASDAPVSETPAGDEPAPVIGDAPAVSPGPAPQTSDEPATASTDAASAVDEEPAETAEAPAETAEAPPSPKK